MGLFEDFILNEAVPRKAKQLGISPDTPPDLTKPNSGKQDPTTDTGADPNQPQQDPNAANTGAPANIDPNAGLDGGDDMGNDPNAPAEELPDPGADPNADDMGDPGAEEDPNMEEDPNALQGPDGVGMEDQPAPGDELRQAEDEVFNDMKPEHKQIRDKELKERYQDFYKIISESLDKLNKVSKTAYDAVMIDLALRQLLQLKDMTFSIITDLFTTRTYVENKIELEKLVTDFNAIVNSITTIYEARVKRAIKYNKGNNDDTGMGSLDYSQDLGW